MSKHDLYYKIVFKFDQRTLMLKHSTTEELLDLPDDLREAFQSMTLDAVRSHTSDKGTYSYGMPSELELLDKCGCTTYMALGESFPEVEPPETIAFSLVLTYDQDECQCDGYGGVADLAENIMSEFDSYYIDKRFYAEWDDQYYCNLDINMEVMRMEMPDHFMEDYWGEEYYEG